MERTCVVMDYPIKYLGRLKAGAYLRYIYEFPVNCVYVADSPIRVWIVRSSIIKNVILEARQRPGGAKI